MLDEATLTDHWLVRAVTGFGDGRWDLAFDGSDTAVFVLNDARSPEWPATLQILRVSQADWPSEAAFAEMRRNTEADIDETDGTIRISHTSLPDQALTFSEVRIVGGLPGSPLRAEMFIDVSPRLHLVAAAAGPDLYELGRVIDLLTDLLSGVRPGVDPAPAAEVARPTVDGV